MDSLFSDTNWNKNFSRNWEKDSSRIFFFQSQLPWSGILELHKLAHEDCVKQNIIERIAYWAKNDQNLKWLVSSSHKASIELFSLHLNYSYQLAIKIVAPLDHICSYALFLSLLKILYVPVLIFLYSVQAGIYIALCLIIKYI